MTKYRNFSELKENNLTLKLCQEEANAGCVGVCDGFHKTQHKYIVVLFTNEPSDDNRKFLLTQEEVKSLYDKHLHIKNIYVKGNSFEYVNYEVYFHETASIIEKNLNIHSYSRMKYKKDETAYRINYQETLHPNRSEQINVNMGLEYDTDLECYNLNAVVEYEEKNHYAKTMAIASLILPDVTLLFDALDAIVAKSCTKQRLANLKN